MPDVSRLALVIGNSEYDNKNASILSCCINDATQIGKSLEDMGFSAKIMHDLNYTTMTDEIKSFIERVENVKTDVTVVVYFSGHGCSKGNSCFIIPIDYSPEMSFAKEELHCVNTIVDKIDNSKLHKKTVIIILDCCRSEIKAKTIKEQDAIKLPKDVYPGYTSPDIEGSIVAYSCKEGTPSYAGLNISPFTECILNNMYRKTDVGRMFRLCNYELSVHRENTNGLQQSRYVDALRSPQEFVLSNKERTTLFRMQRSDVVCKQTHNEQAIFPLNPDTCRVEYMNHRTIMRNEEIEVLVNDEDFLHPVKNWIIIKDHRVEVRAKNGTKILLKGRGFPIVDCKNNKYTVEDKSFDDNSNIITEKLVLLKKCCKPLNDYRVKVRILKSKYVGYILASWLPEHMRQTLVPYFKSSYSYWED
jgi:hypothetical protein